MSNMNTNKTMMAILLAGLIGMTTGKVSEFLYFGGPEHPGEHSEAKRGFSIEVAADATAADGASAPAGAADISALYATADVKAGEAYFNKKCTTCHDGSKGGANKVGPALYGVMNRAVASAPGFNYSAALKAKGGKWTFEEMNKFQWSPQKTIPGTMMSFAGTPKDQDRANLIAFLNSNSASPAKLPTASAKPAAAPAAAAKK